MTIPQSPILWTSFDIEISHSNIYHLRVKGEYNSSLYPRYEYYRVILYMRRNIRQSPLTNLITCYVLMCDATCITCFKQNFLPSMQGQYSYHEMNFDNISNLRSFNIAQHYYTYTVSTILATIIELHAHANQAEYEVPPCHVILIFTH